MAYGTVLTPTCSRPMIRRTAICHPLPYRAVTRWHFWAVAIFQATKAATSPPGWRQMGWMAFDLPLVTLSGLRVD